GLFDIRLLSKMLVVQGGGYGGGSLVYANVQMRPPASAFAQGWPSGFNRDELARYYDLVAYMLDVKQITQGHKDVPLKTGLMREAAKNLDRLGQFFYPNLAVDLSAPEGQHENKFHIPQRGCTYCGNCIIGCADQAKNTLDLNYLAVAEQHNAD